MIAIMIHMNYLMAFLKINENVIKAVSKKFCAKKRVRGKTNMDTVRVKVCGTVISIYSYCIV